MDESGTTARLRRLPAIGLLLDAPQQAQLLAEYGRPLLTQAVRQAVQVARTSITAGQDAEVGPPQIQAALQSLTTPSLRPVINATGVVLHTNMGRARLAPVAMQAAQEAALSYSNLEMDLEEGGRGDRHAHVDQLLAELLGTEGGLAFNNCAGSTFLMLAALCRDTEVIVARSELVEIGGGFRIPDVLKESGAILVEVGTTNKVYARDYEAAITERTGAILVVHRSNFAIVGFTAQPSLQELKIVADKAGVPLLVDQGSGLFASAEDLGPAAAAMADEPRPREVLNAGADLVTFSGDKLMGGPQAGLLAGRAELLMKAKKHPLARALRADKMTLAALEATLRLYRSGQAQQIPTIRDLSVDLATLKERAKRLSQQLKAATQFPVNLIDGESLPGGGSLPLCRLPTRVLLVGAPGAPARRLARQLRRGTPAVVTRMVSDRVALDVRTIADNELAMVVAAMSAASPATEKIREGK